MRKKTTHSKEAENRQLEVAIRKTRQKTKLLIIQPEFISDIVKLRNKWHLPKEGLSSYEALCGWEKWFGEEKFRKRKVGEPRHHVYYHCGRVKDPSCREPFLSEEELIKSLLQFINFMAMAHPQTLKFTPNLKQSMDSYNSVREETLIRQDINPKSNELTFLEYAQYILRSGSNEEKIELTKVFGKQLYIHNKEICGTSLR